MVHPIKRFEIWNAGPFSDRRPLHGAIAQVIDHTLSEPIAVVLFVNRGLKFKIIAIVFKLKPAISIVSRRGIVQQNPLLADKSGANED